MADKLTSLIEMFHYLKKSGRSATLTMSTKEGQATRVKLEVELDDATPRKILTVKKPAGCQPTFAALDLDGAPPSSMRPPPCGYNCERIVVRSLPRLWKVFLPLPRPQPHPDGAEDDD